MDPKTKQLVEESEARAANATPGPWTDDNGYRVRRADGEVVAETKHCLGSIADDSEFIAHARDAIPALCSAVREQDKLLDAWQLAVNATSPEYAKEVYDRRLAEVEQLLKEYQDASKRARHAEAERDSLVKKLDKMCQDNAKLESTLGRLCRLNDAYCEADARRTIAFSLAQSCNMTAQQDELDAKAADANDAARDAFHELHTALSDELNAFRVNMLPSRLEQLEKRITELEAERDAFGKRIKELEAQRCEIIRACLGRDVKDALASQVLGLWKSQLKLVEYAVELETKLKEQTNKLQDMTIEINELRTLVTHDAS